MKRSFDPAYFETPSPAASYLLGFLFADGTITTNPRGSKYLAVQVGDRSVLAYLKCSLGATQRIVKRSGLTHPVYRIQIGSKALAASLEGLGFVPGKTMRMRIPELDPGYLRHFVRGYFDGDGNVWVGTIHPRRPHRSTGIIVAFTSASKGFLQDLRRITQEHAGTEGRSLFPIKEGRAWRLSYSGRNALKIHDFMYNNEADFFLPRKRKVFERYLRT
jgi:hypothetical protein